MVLAAIPVFLIFGAVDKFLTAIQKYNASFESAPAQSEAQPEPPAPIESSSEPGMVFLQPNLESEKKPQAKADQAPNQEQKKK
jgi:hypothetical protein